jgi:hypothetical protein
MRNIVVTGYRKFSDRLQVYRFYESASITFIRFFHVVKDPYEGGFVPRVLLLGNEVHVDYVIGKSDHAARHLEGITP